MPIYPLPQFEAELKQLNQDDREAYEALKPPKTVVVRFGFMKLIGEFPFGGDAKPGCGSKLVVRTFRGTELGEMLTSTCPNSGCSKSVSRQDMLQYIENSGGRDYPFSTEGRVLRIATGADLDAQARIEQSKHGLKLQAREVATRLNLDVKIVEAEPILGAERLTFFYLSEERRDVHALQSELAALHHCRVELRAVGARDEARLTADYERCGQYCCCKNFLKVLKPVSMKSAKTQKATLDPLKISGRCGRLMCCLRYEDETYETLRKRLPRKKTRVGTPEGDGLVLDGQILTQLVLVQLDEPNADGTPHQVAVAVEDLTEPKSQTAPERPPPIESPRMGRDGGLRPPGAPPSDRPSDRPRFGSERKNEPRSADPRPAESRPAESRPAPTPGSGPAQERPAMRPPPRPSADDEIDLDDIPTDDGRGSYVGPRADPRRERSMRPRSGPTRPPAPNAPSGPGAGPRDPAAPRDARDQRDPAGPHDSEDVDDSRAAAGGPADGPGDVPGDGLGDGPARKRRRRRRRGPRPGGPEGQSGSPGPSGSDPGGPSTPPPTPPTSGS